MDKVGTIMRTDGDRSVREMAAMRLSLSESPPKALEAYRAAFATEYDLCVRWALMRFAIRAGGEAALPLAKQFAEQDSRLRQDYLDFQAIYAQGVVDFDRVWLAKTDGHDECLSENGAM